MRTNTINDYYNKIDKSNIDGCWIFTGYLDSKGYGAIRLGEGKRILTHRLAYHLANPDWLLSSKLFVLHKCDNPPCVNPEHLFLGTGKDNMQDKTQKGRAAKGEQIRKGNGLSREKVIAIFSLKNDGLTHEKIAKKIGCCQTSVSNVLNGKCWSWLNTEKDKI